MRIDIGIDSTDFPSNANLTDIISFFLNHMKEKFGLKNDQIGVTIVRGHRFLRGDYEGNLEEVEKFFNELYADAQIQFV